MSDTPVTLESDGEIAIVVVNNPPVNALSHAVRSGVVETLERIANDSDYRGVLLTCAGRTFFAGADITEFGKPPVTPDLREMLAALDNFPLLTVAVIHGTALGGGLEAALCCNYRVAADSARVGLPESKLGLLPGAGGTQRLPRVAGVEPALDMMVTGNLIPATDALEYGVVDHVVPSASLQADALAWIRDLLEGGAPHKRASETDLAPVGPEFFDEYRRRIERTTRGYEAPERIVQCVEAAVSLPFEEGMVIERDLFVESLESTQSAALRHLFFAERAAGKIPGLDRGTEAREIGTVGIIGSGTMGVGIALACMNAGLPVILLDSEADSLAAGVARIGQLLDGMVDKRRLTEEDRDIRMELLTASGDIDALADVDLVIEAVFESMAVKEQVFADLDRVCRRGAILATNTSTLDVDRIAAATTRPGDVVGLHFFSPAHLMRLLEIVRGQDTTDEVLVTALALAKRIGKLGVVVGNCFGFVGNRMLYGYGRENQLLLLEGANPERIDTVLTDWGMAMGPNAVGDLAGLDVGYKVRSERDDLPDDPRYYRIADLLAAEGRFGQKTGAGMFRYEKGSRRPIPDPDVQKMIEREAKRLGIERRQIPGEEVVERCIYALVLEGARVLEDRIATRSSDIDVIWANGYGFPRWRGGPMFYADTVGLDKVYETVLEFARRFGPEYWTPPSLLVRLARDGGKFSEL